MQNSIWKLTALAGVVGVGLLIVLQAQNGIKPDPNSITQNTSDENNPKPNGSDDPNWQPNEQSEPTVETREVIGQMKVDPLADPGNAKTKTTDRQSFFTASDDSDIKMAGLFDSSNGPDFESETTVRSQANDPSKLFADSESPFSDSEDHESDAVFASFDDAKPTSAVAAPATAPAAIFQEDSLYSEFANEANQQKADSTANSAEPKLLTIVSNDSPFFDSEPAANSAKGQQLLLDSRRAMQVGDLKTARSLATSADNLNLKYGALEDRPDLVLRKIDALVAQKSRTPIFDEAGSVRENESGIIPVAGVVFDETEAADKTESKDPSATSIDDKKPGIFEGDLDSFDPGKASGSVELLPDNPPKLLVEPSTLFQSESKNDTASQIESSNLDSPKLASSPFEPDTNSALQIDKPFSSTPIKTGSLPSEPLPNFDPQPLQFDDSKDDPSPAQLDPAKSRATTRITRDAEPEKKEVRGDGVIPENAPASEEHPELTIEKVAPPEATLGKPMIYSIVILNRGSANATKVTVEDVIPLGCKLVGTIPQAELVGSKLTWRLGRLASGERKKIHVKVVPIAEGEIGSVAKVSFVAEVAARTKVRQPKRASIRVTATAPNQARIGETVKLHFKIQNTGQTDANEMTLQNLIPKGFDHPAGADLTYEIGQIKAGESVDVDLELKAIKEGTYINRAIIKEDGAVRTESKATIKIIDAWGLTLQSLRNRAGIVGQRMNHSFKVSNPSGILVKNARAIARLPRQVRFVKAGGGGQYNPATHSIEWLLEPLPSKQSVTFTSTITATTFGEHTARLQVTQPDSPMIQIDSDMAARGIAALAINLTNVPATANPGDEFTVDATITNRGTGPDTNVRFSMSLPSSIKFVSARGPVKNGIVQTSVGKKVIPFAVIPEIGEQASVSFQVTLRARSAGRPKLRAEVSSQQLDEPVATEAAVVVLEAP